MVLVVTDDEEGTRTRLADLGQESLGAAGVVAITGPRGYGTNRILTELQQAWLLGYGDVSIVSPVSVILLSGISLARRFGQYTLGVVMSDDTFCWLPRTTQLALQYLGAAPFRY